MFADPQSVTVSGAANSLPRIGVGPSSALYSKSDGKLQLSISHANGKRNRRTAGLTFTKIAADPLLDGVSREYWMKAYIVIDHPTVGFSTTEVADNVKALTDYLATAGVVLKIVGGES